KTASGRVTNNWPTWTVRYWLDTLWMRPDDLRVTALPVTAGGAVDRDRGPGSRAAAAASGAAEPTLAHPATL
ncbi:MAG TPA: hypothetical protein VGF11_00775, partial [Acidimicrobiales bacterium]